MYNFSEIVGKKLLQEKKEGNIILERKFVSQQSPCSLSSTKKISRI